MSEQNQIPAEEKKTKRPKHHPVRMQRIPAHLEGAAALEKLCFSNPWSAKSMELLTSDGIGVGYLCTASVAPGTEPTAVAYGGMLITVDEGQITNIATHPDYRRRGYGKAIVESLIKYAKMNGLDSISLEVRESNAAAIELYTKLGFKVEGKRRDFYTKPVEAALVMIWRA